MTAQHSNSEDGDTESRSRLRPLGLQTPRAAGFTGVLFAALFTAAVLIARSALPGSPTSTTVDYSKVNTAVLALAVNLVGFAGVFFLWFVGVVRSRMGRREDQFFSTVLLGSGIIFVALLFAWAAVIAAGLAQLHGKAQGQSGNLRLARDLGYSFVFVFVAKMAGVFMGVTTTILRRIAPLSRWLVIFGYAGAVVMLFTLPHAEFLIFVFPAWVLCISIHILRTGFDDGDPRVAVD